MFFSFCEAWVNPVPNGHANICIYKGDSELEVAFLREVKVWLPRGFEGLPRCKLGMAAECKAAWLPRGCRGARNMLPRGCRGPQHGCEKKTCLCASIARLQDAYMGRVPRG